MPEKYVVPLYFSAGPGKVKQIHRQLIEVKSIVYGLIKFSKLVIITVGRESGNYSENTQKSFNNPNGIESRTGV